MTAGRPRTGSRLPRSFELFRNRDFTLFAIGAAASQTGAWMRYVAIGWAIRELTDSSVALGFGFAAMLGPSLLVSPIAGVLADRYDRKRTIMIGNLAMGIPPILTGLLVASGHATVLGIILLTFVGGLLQSIVQPSMLAVLPTLVGDTEVPRAVGMNAGIMNLTRVIGPGLGGVVIGLMGLDWAFYLNGLGFVGVVVAWSFIRGSFRPPDHGHEAFLHQLRVGASFARHTPVVARLLVLTGVFSILSVHAPLVPEFADSVLGSGVGGYALLSTATGVGAVLGAFAAAELVGRRARRRSVALGAFGVGLSWLGFALSGSLWLSAAMLAGFGLAYFAMMATVTSTIMLATPDDLRGRVMGLFNMVWVGTVPVAAIAAGFLAEMFGPQATVAGAALLSLAYTGWFVATGGLDLVGSIRQTTTAGDRGGATAAAPVAAPVAPSPDFLV